MPSIFSDEDKEVIRKKLIFEGTKMMTEQGITKMNLEKLAYSAGIAKGTFYNFFRTKQHFILAIIRDYQKQKYDVLKKEAEQKKGTLTVYEALHMYLKIYDPKENPMFHMRDSDLDWIASKIPPSELFDSEMDLTCCSMILSCVKGLRKDIDYRIVSNFSRMVMFTLMQREYVHQEVLPDNIKMIIDMLASYITENISDTKGAPDHEI